jgi:threonine dehydrogenase-like Zn-dependent dehydrogenase
MAMKALVYTATRETAYQDAPEPELRPGEALVKVDAVGICGSDMHAWHGHDPRRVPPLVLGHEACGTVLEGPAPGGRVVLNPLISCGTCGFCKEGRANLCAERELIGMRLPGAFAERIAIPARNLIPVPEGMDPAKAALTEPCATAWHGLALAERAAWRPIAESRALVIGGGSVGLLAGLILEAWAPARCTWPRPIRCAAKPPPPPAWRSSTHSRHRPSAPVSIWSSTPSARRRPARPRSPPRAPAARLRTSACRTGRGNWMPAP